MKVSRRICAFASFSFSSIFVVLDLLRADVVDDLDALPLLHVVGDDLADRAVRERVVADVDREVVEEVRAPQPLEVVEEGLLGAVVVGHPDALGRAARLELDVIEVGLRVDERRVALRLEAGRDEQHDRAGAGRRLGQRRRLLAADGRCGQGRRRLGRLGPGSQRAETLAGASERAMNASAATAHTRNPLSIYWILDWQGGDLAGNLAADGI